MKIKAALLICVFLCLILFSGATDTVLEPVETPIASYSGGQFKYIDHSSGRVSLVVGDTLFSFDEDGGNVAVSSCSGRIRSSLVKGGSACFITDNGYSLSFEEHSVYGGIIRSADSIIDPSLYGYVTAMTVGGKALGKGIAIGQSQNIVEKISVIIYYLTNITRIFTIRKKDR